ncbi:MULTISPECIES: XTP/dITP diphosphatase [Pseudoalteromonas]|uniref:dITP/XTP pyrophosphatase n=1 Tax=Pseudoalteromonas luteoviolacea (strain 2ta16) TaxID=1353533 RepID=V4JD12_PSEL2|nr:MULTISPECIES: XTP/dITP diphosphatase [Pseudoalteromonas]ESP92962.1 non-canonical purine NTP pyrophosphatase, rdgB/HAM1 family [Pseudoalteromonas luteoviolacea 2ta16]KZN43225.1 NTP phosphatase [Pseudoalteromonas luteoviolacea NCIMB 1944]MCG7549398.1 XTP/dITP diphosphatase [Pseudoalteromonas sp. Of7M-16]
MTKQIVLATGNQGKVRELGGMLESLQIEVLPQSQFDVSDVEETGTTFVENAIIKARHAAKETGLPAIADDSGLEVDALDGAPGVYSARFAGSGASDQQNIDKLLVDLEGVTNRTARFWCVLVYMRHANDPTPVICQASWEGAIAAKPHGDGGFGYDPVFWVENLQRMAAELSKEEKNTVSHRGKALQQLMTHFKSIQ